MRTTGVLSKINDMILKLENNQNEQAWIVSIVILRTP